MADILSNHVSCLNSQKFVPDQRLGELGFGSFVIKQARPFCQFFPKNIIDHNVKVGGEESLMEMKKRCVEIIKDVCRTKIKNCVLVTHCGPLRAIFAHFLCMDLSFLYNHVRFYNCSISKIIINKKTKKLISF